MQDGQKMEMVQKYYDEVSAFIKDKLGCKKVVCMHYQVHNSVKVGRGFVQGYAGGTPHTDSLAVLGNQTAISKFIF